VPGAPDPQQHASNTLIDMIDEERTTMSSKQDFAAQVKAQSEVWQAQIKDYREQLKQTGATAKADYERLVSQMRGKAEEASSLFNQVEKANDAAWKEMQSAQQRALAELQKGWADALSRFP
jgi:predicted nucleotide-binding protein (sugar kinase/HSP70/actin superfamily)